MASEEWRPIVGFEGRYEVSDLGRVRGLRFGRVKKDTEKQGKRYRLVGLSKNNRGRSYSVHRLVAEAFHGPCPEGMECCHLNGDPADNRAANLTYATRKENHAHKLLHGTEQIGERHGQARLTDSVVLSIRRRVRCGEQFTALASEFGVTDTCVRRAATGYTWRHLPNALGCRG